MKTRGCLIGELRVEVAVLREEYGPVDARTERTRTVVAPTLESIIRLEGYFRIHGLQRIADRLESALQECEAIMTGARSLSGPADDSDDALLPDDQDQQPYSAESTPAKRGRAALG